jgi:hypothetical protein
MSLLITYIDQTNSQSNLFSPFSAKVYFSFDDLVNNNELDESEDLIIKEKKTS